MAWWVVGGGWWVVGRWARVMGAGAAGGVAAPSLSRGTAPLVRAGAPLCSPATPSSLGHPRRRGEHALPAIIAGFTWGSSPPTRGARGRVHRRSRHRDHPRRRGEHARLSVSGTRRSWIIPAYAGSTRASRASGRISRDHPRLRGEHGAHDIDRKFRDGSSPPTRGARVPSRGHGSASGIIPAYAGSTPLGGRPRRRQADHPRLRGEHVHTPHASRQTRGSSPPTRGALLGHVELVARVRIIPAYAGSTTGSRPPASPRTDHPRLRGEHVSGSPVTLQTGGSSPPTRGARVRPARSRHSRRIIPAYAGSTAPSTHAFRADSGSSPPTRGAHGPARPPAEAPGIIPAYAGSTLAPSSTPLATWDHPRLRGEHVGSRRTIACPTGSSPPTRGALLGRGRDERPQGIIPAYAGSTR